MHRIATRAAPPKQKQHFMAGNLRNRTAQTSQSLAKRGATKLTPNAKSVLRCMTRHAAQILHPWSQMDWQQQPVKRDMLRWQMERPVIRRFWAAQAPLQTGREHNPAGTRNEAQAGNVLHTLWTLTLTSTRQQQLSAATFHFISFHVALPTVTATVVCLTSQVLGT